MSFASRLSAPALLTGLFVVSLPLVNPYVRGDGNGYYAYVRSVVIDGDLDFENEFRHGDPLFRELYFDERGAVRPSMYATTGRVINQWAVGPSILWLPWFLAAHAIVGVLDWFGAAVAADGFSAPYRWSCAIGTACYGWAAVMLAWAIAVRLAGARASLIATLALWWASPLPVYMYFLPFHVHALAAFAVAVFLWIWLRALPERARPARWLLWGALAGLMVAVYYLNAVFALIVPVELWRRWRRGALSLAQLIPIAAALVAGAALALAPHVAVKWIAHGSPLVTGYRDEFFWTAPRLWQVAFSTEHGLFLWTPVAIAAVAGLAQLARRQAAVGGGLLAVFVLFYYCVASYQNWHGQSSFGNRFFVSFTSAFVLGAAVLVEAADRSGRARAVRALTWAVVALLVAWNVGFMFQWGANIVPNRGPVDFVAVAHNQVTIVPQRLVRFGWRYLTDRNAVISEVEGQDQVEDRTYEPEAMSPFVYFLVHLTFFYTCIEGLVINIMFPATLPFIYKDLVLILVYVGVFVPNLTRVLDPPPIIRTIGLALALFSAMLLVYVLVPSPVTLLGELVAVKQRLFYIPLAVVAYFFVRTEDDLKGLIAAMSVYAIGVSIFGIYLFFSGPEALVRLGGTYAAVFYTPVTTPGVVSVWRVPGTFTSSGQYGGYLAFNAIVTTALLAMPKTRVWMRGLAGVALVFIILAMLASGSRASIVVTLAGIALAVMMSGRVARLGVWAIAAYAVLAYAFVLLGPGVQDRFDSIASAENIARFQHTYFGQLFLSSVFDSPLGHGLGIATIGARHFTEFSQLVFMESYFGILAVETGLPGVLTFVFVAAAMVALIVRYRGLMSASPNGPLWLGLASYLLLIVSLMSVSTTIDHAPSNFYFWFSLGALVRLIELEYWRRWEEDEGQAPAADGPA